MQCTLLNSNMSNKQQSSNLLSSKLYTGTNCFTLNNLNRTVSYKEAYNLERKVSKTFKCNRLLLLQTDIMIYYGDISISHPLLYRL